MNIIATTIKELNEIIKKFVQTFDEDYSAEIGADFAADLDNNSVVWTLIYSEDGGKAFYSDFCNRYPPAKNYSFFLLSLLHEIGHLETEDEMIDDTDIRNTDLSNEEYFNLFNERLATDWAGEWIEENLTLAKQIDSKISFLLNNFYKVALAD